MANTPIYGFRYPTLTQPPNVPLDVQNLATDVETVVAALAAATARTYPRIAASGSGANASFTGAMSTSYTLASVAVPDPGFPYRIEAKGAIFLSGLSNASAGVSHQFGAMVGTQSLNGPSQAPTADTIGSMFIGQTNTTFAVPTFDRVNPTIYTGAKTVYLILLLGSLGPATWGPLNQRSDYEFTVRVIRA